MITKSKQADGVVTRARVKPYGYAHLAETGSDSEAALARANGEAPEMPNYICLYTCLYNRIGSDWLEPTPASGGVGAAGGEFSLGSSGATRGGR